MDGSRTSDRRPSDVRRCILADHERLRGIMSHLDSLTSYVLMTPEAQAQDLRGGVLEACQNFRRHMQYELAMLRPILLEADRWGEQRVRSLELDHEFQLTLLDLLEHRARDPREGAYAIALLTHGLMRLLQQDMADEERSILSETALRDDRDVLPEPH